MESLEMGILSTLPRPRARRRQHFNSEPTDEYPDSGSGELSGDSLARIDIWRCSVSSWGEFLLLTCLNNGGNHSMEPTWQGGLKCGTLFEASHISAIILGRSEPSITSIYRGLPCLSATFRPHYCTTEPAPTSHPPLGRFVNQCSAMSKRLKLSDLAKVVAQKAATSASKGVVISEGSETTSGKRALDDGSKGKQVAQSPEPKKARIDTGASGAPARPPVASGVEKILAGVILPADKEKVDRLTFDQVVTKFLHVLGQQDFAECAHNQKAVAESDEMEMVRAQNRAIELEGPLAEEKVKGKKLTEDADAKDKVIAKFEARISELEKEPVSHARQDHRRLTNQYPDLGVDLEDVEMDHELLAKEEAEAEKRTAEEGAAGGQSLISTRTSQSPSFPPIPPNSPEMDTSSLTKEGNVMSQAELNKLGSTYSFPSGVRLRIPGDGETILSARQGEVAFYEAAFLASLRLPIHPTIREILIHYKICPAQLSPNAWRSVICSLVIWRHFKRHMSCDEFRIPEQRKGVEDEVLFCLGGRVGVPFGHGRQRYYRSSQILGNAKLVPISFFWFASLWSPDMRFSGKSCNKLPTLSEVDAKRTEAIFGKIESGGYFEVSKVLGSRTFRKHFAVGCTALSTSGGDNTTSGDEGEFVTREDSVEYLGVIRRGIGGAIRRACPAMSARAGAPALGEKTGGKAKAEKATTAKPPTKGVVIREKRTREGVPGRAAEAGTSSPGGDVGSESMSDASVARRLLTRVIPASDKKEVDQLSENELVAKFFHALGQVVVFASSLALHSQEHLHDIDFHMARADSVELELVKAQKRAVKAENRLVELSEEGSKPGTEVDDLKATVEEPTNKLAKAKELAIEDFKASGEFKAAVTDSAATYFSDGFEFCKRQLLHQFPNLGVDVANMAMDPIFAEEEGAMKGGEDPVAGVAPNV
ncbi:hypothetical protein Acr_03g0010370 [Actinidia rufa]|uniref:Transposase (putative) gypsy type domain-containing protein n=1 Tax=Actinidia rufa TaxID=165716 RepID=A0A7J0ECR6_9ERIC|nr:hypothetical protein Acr_03g0010370 [Actinidia rufa]